MKHRLICGRAFCTGVFQPYRLYPCMRATMRHAAVGTVARAMIDDKKLEERLTALEAAKP